MATTIISHRGESVDERARSRSWVDSIVRTRDSAALTVLRLGLGIVILPHGLQKAVGMFGGAGFSGTIQYFGSQGIPAVLATLVILGEFLGSIGLIVGFLTRIAAFGIFCVMLGATMLVHLPNGFFMNWSGQQAGEGFEFHLLAMAMAVALMLGGAGRASIDRSIFTRSEGREEI